MEQHEAPKEFQPFDDLVDIDAYGHAHRPDGKFMPLYEVEQIGVHQEQIREMDPNAYVGRHRETESATEAIGTSGTGKEEGVNIDSAQEVSEADTENAENMLLEAAEQIQLSDEVPPLVADETNPDRLAVTRAFFNRRKQALSTAARTTNAVLQVLIGKNIAGVDITASQWVRARLHPAQLKHNAKSNLAPLFGRRYTYDLPTDNPVIRNVFYDKAAEGDSAALRYISSHDMQLGKTEYNTLDYMREFATIMSGAAVARKVGLYAVFGVSAAGALLSKDPVKQQRHIERIEKVEEKNAIEFGSHKFNTRKEQYAAVAAAIRNKRPPSEIEWFRQNGETRPRDPFEHLRNM